LDTSKFIVIDGNAIVHRAFHAYPPTLTTNDGVQVNAVYGFATMLLKVIDMYDPKYVFCAMDTPKKTFRHKKYPEYKAQRKPVDPALIAQFSLVEDLLGAFNIPVIKKEGFEADDIIGTVSAWVESGKWSTMPIQMIAVTGDKDLLQLVGERVKIALPNGRTFSTLRAFNRQDVFDKYGYYPEQVIDYKSMVGDPSDNIPGVKGVGDKSALTLLQKYGNFEEIYKHLDDTKPRWKKLLSEGVEQAKLSRDLATIKCDMDLSLELESCLLKDFDSNKLVQMFTEFGFRTLIDKIPNSVEDNIKSVSVEGGQIGLFAEEDIELDLGGKASLQVLRGDEIRKVLNNISKAYILYVSKKESANGEEFCGLLTVDKMGEHKEYEVDNIKSGFTPSLNCETYTYNLEGMVSRIDLSDINIIDVAQLSHLQSTGRSSSSFSKLCFSILSEVIPDTLYRDDLSVYLKLIERLGLSLIRNSRNLLLHSYSEKMIDYAIGSLEESLEKVLVRRENRYLDVCQYIEAPISKVLADMETRGVLLSIDYLLKLKEELLVEIGRIQEKIYKEIGHEFNIASPSQVAEVLYDELKLGIGQRNRTTRESVLLKMKDMHPVVPLILKFREVSKILSTYVDPFAQMVELGQGVDLDSKFISIHTDYKQMGTSSGRFASQNPNMQNIPARGTWASRVREMFVARDGMSYVALDYSQIESRIMADISNDEALIRDFKLGKDIHTVTASKVLGKPIKDITPAERSRGKTVNFGILYGQTEYGLASMLEIPKEKAKKMIDSYFKHYKGIATYIKNSEKMARERGYVESMFGRRRYVLGLKSENRRVYDGALREAINMPIQGGDADIMKLAMILVDRMIAKEYPDKVFGVLQVHDEMIYEVTDDITNEFAEKAKDVMENVIELKVPLEVHYNIGKDLAELK